MYRCGIVMHQTYNQLFPLADADLAEKVRDKTLLGYHDVRTGNEPDSRLSRFITEHLPVVLPDARERFDNHRDLMVGFVSGDLDYPEFAARVRRRSEGTNEDWDEPVVDEF